MFLLGYLAHRRDCKAKQLAREQAIASLPQEYRFPLTPHGMFILNTPLPQLIQYIHSNDITPLDVLTAYGKQALQAHAKTNCLTEIMIAEEDKKLQQQALIGGQARPRRVLEGIPVSIKDLINVEGYDSTIGYSAWIGKRAERDAPMVRLLRDAGAIPFVKTNVPITLLSFESTNDVFGRTSNPYNPKYSPGGSSGGESALIALGGSRVGIGSDIAGSVRVPAHYCGIYSLKCSNGRFPRLGAQSSAPGQEGVPGVCSPMARSLADLTYFLKAMLSMKPWEYDNTVHPIPWRDVEQEYSGRRIRWGVMRDDGVVTPTPACARALETVVQSLKKVGDEIVELNNFPSPYQALKVGSHLLSADGGRLYSSHFRSMFEYNDAGVREVRFYLKLPRFIRWLYIKWTRYVRRDELWAGLLENFREQTIHEQWDLVKQREIQRYQWFIWWQKTGIDFLITVPNSAPAIPEGGMKRAISGCGYTLLFNLLDLPAAVVPVTTVQADADALPPTFSLKNLNEIAKGVYSQYDSKKMEGLPVGVQIVHGRRLEEECVLHACERIEEALERKTGEGLSGGVGWEGGIKVELPEDTETELMGEWRMAGSEMLGGAAGQT